jgi:hypothetical protein
MSSNCTIIGVALEEYHNSIKTRRVYTVRRDDGLMEYVDACHVDDQGIVAATGHRGQLRYELTQNGAAYILTVRPGMQAGDRRVAG